MKVRSKFENKVLVSFAAAIVMVLAIAGNMWKASHDALDAGRWVSQTFQTLDALADARADLFRIESSVRGYLVSENAARLAERDAAISSLETALPRIKALVDDNSRQTESWKQLRAAVDARLATHAHTVMLRKNQGLDAAREYIADTPQREVLRQSSIEILQEMEAEEWRQLQNRDLEEKRLRKIAVAAALGVTLVIVALLALTYVLIRRQFAYSRAARERSEEAARARKALLDAADVAIISTDAEGVIRSFNPAAERMLGYAAAELVGSQTPAVAHDPAEIVARARQFSEELGETIAPGFEVFVAKTRRNLPNAHEWTYVRKDGARLQVLLSVSAMRDGAGSVIGFLGVATDITKRKAAEQALAQERNRLDLALTATGLSMWDADVCSGQVSLDQRWAAMIGKEPQPCVTTTDDLLKLAPPSDRDRLRAAAADAASGRTSEYRVEHQVRAKNREWRWIESYGKVVERDAQGRALRVIGINADITERKRAQLALAANEAQLRLITDNVPAMIGHYDENEICRFANSAYAALYGQTVPGIRGRHLHLIAGGETYRAIEPFIRAALAGETVQYERTHRSEAEPERALAVSLVPQPNASGRPAGFYVMIIDVTERKQAEQALLAAKNAAELANRAKDSFLATMSHEIRTPLNGMLGMLELLGFSRLDGEQREALEAARDSGRSLVRIIDDVLDHARIEAGKLEIRTERVSIAQILRRVVNTYSAVASTKGLMLRQISDPRISPALLADPLRLMQILGNFVSNAVKFTAQGYVEVRAELIAREDRADTVRLSVKDTGIGIAPEALQRLFRPFEQATTDTARLYGGTGLGLSISRRLAEMMGGTIDVESKPGEGTTMSVSFALPILDAASAEDAGKAAALATAVATAQTARAAPGEGALVLAVDDHPINRNLLTRQLAALGLRAQTAADGQEALALWQGGEFASVIVDCNMPVMDGYAFSRAVRAIEAREGRPRTPIIAWTANVLPDAAAQCRAAGMDDVLTKPVELTALKEALAKWMPAATASFPRPVLAGSEPDGTAQGTPIDYGELDKIAVNAADRMDILQDFMEQTRSDLAQLEAALKDKDLAACGRIAHRMKGASRMVGARELAAESEAFEKTARQGGPNNADAVKAALQRLAAHLAEAQGTNKEKL
ncbi:MAG: PAS domain S-box protein [Betaproteobacteria bacterium]|nr:PAS domain S-box protein [Betaproteobacteria bacterium]